MNYAINRQNKKKRIIKENIINMKNKKKIKI